MRINTIKLRTPMKIGFDGKRAVCNMTGLGNYSRLAVDVLSRYYPDNEYLLYTPDLRINRRILPLIARDKVSLTAPDTALGWRFLSIWREWGISSQMCRDGIDLYHGLSNELPLSIRRTGIPSVVTIHDLVFRHFPEYYKFVDRKIYDYKFRKAAENATRVIAVSECTRRDIVDSYGIDPAKIDVIYQGCDPQFHTVPTTEQVLEVVKKHNLRTPYIIGVGTIEKRKNQMLTLEALASLPEELSLVLVGRRTGYAKQIERRARRLSLSHRLRILEGINFTEFPALYAGAVASSYPSRFEGFGIPVIESLSVGTPVVVARGSCLEEAAGPAAPAVDPDSADDLAEGLRKVIYDSAFRTDSIERGRCHALSFDERTMASSLMEIYNKAICQKNS